MKMSTGKLLLIILIILLGFTLIGCPSSNRTETSQKNIDDEECNFTVEDSCDEDEDSSKDYEDVKDKDYDILDTN